MMKKMLMIFLVVLFLAGCGGNDTTGKSVQDINMNVPEEVVVVNGEKIYQNEIDTMKKQVGEKMNESAIIEQMVAKELLLQEAEKRGLSVSDGQAEQKISEMLSQRGSSLDSVKQRLPEKQYNQLLKQQKEQIILQKLAEEAANVSVSDEELRNIYEQRDFGNMTYEQVAPRLEQMVKQRNKQKALSVLAEKLRQKADVVYK